VRDDRAAERAAGAALRRAQDHASSLLWDPLGEAYVDLVAPAPGDRVLDACCGAGASAIPAARAVGASGTVDAVDLTPA
jgi:ubiquinone/menaquinone biosynthesis C-methylase UbiE